MCQFKVKAFIFVRRNCSTTIPITISVMTTFSYIILLKKYLQSLPSQAQIQNNEITWTIPHHLAGPFLKAVVNRLTKLQLRILAPPVTPLEGVRLTRVLVTLAPGLVGHGLQQDFWVADSAHSVLGHSPFWGPIVYLVLPSHEFFDQAGICLEPEVCESQEKCGYCGGHCL